MSGHFTCVNELLDRAPRARLLRGNQRRPEPGQHIVEFPGGAIELTRLDDGSYWAHIIVNRGFAANCFEGRQAARGTVVDSRIDWDNRDGAPIPCLPDGAALTQLAVRIMPEMPG